MMSPRKKAQTAFASALLLLFLSAVAGYFSITLLRESEEWVIHTSEVRNALGDIDWAVLRAGRARTGYVTTQSVDYLNQFDAAVSEIQQDLTHLRDLTKDNPTQQELCSRLESLAAQRVALLKQSIEAKKQRSEKNEWHTDSTP